MDVFNYPPAMGLLAKLFPINPWSVGRLLDDIHEVALFARDIGPKVEDLGARYETLAQSFLGLAGRLDQLIGQVVKVTGPLESAVERVGRIMPRLTPRDPEIES
jgi:hypothetical protein